MLLQHNHLPTGHARIKVGGSRYLQVCISHQTRPYTSLLVAACFALLPGQDSVMIFCRGIGRKVTLVAILNCSFNTLFFKLQLAIPVLVFSVLGWILYVIGFAAFNNTDN